MFSQKHELRNSKIKLFGGELVPSFECPVRAVYILEHLKSEKIGDIVASNVYGRDPIARIHDRSILSFLEHCWSDWFAERFNGEAISMFWPSRAMPQNRIPDSI